MEFIKDPRSYVEANESFLRPYPNSLETGKEKCQYFDFHKKNFMFEKRSPLLNKNFRIYKPEHLYLIGKLIDDYDAEGSFILAAARVAKRFAKSHESYYYEQLDSIDNLLECLKWKASFLIGGINNEFLYHITVDFECFQSIYDTADDGLVPMPKGTERSLGRHAVQALQYIEKDNLVLFKNSWSDWGKNGRGYLSLEYLNLYLREVCVSNRAQYGLDYEKSIKYDKGPYNNEEFKKIWMEKNERDLIDVQYRNQKLNIISYTTYDGNGHLVEIFDLNDHEDFRIGWAHVSHAQIDEMQFKKSTITELFIWPIFRRKGYGTLLENYCCEAAKNIDSTSIQILIYEMDDIKGVMAPVRLFCKKLNYTFVAQKKCLPCISGYEEKNI